jgi:ribosomal-protein-alanine N-acetyltransferase
MITVFTEEHINAASEAEIRCFSVPWSKESLKLLVSPVGFGLVATVDGDFAAYGGMMCVADDAQILNIATLPEYRRRGLAKEILSGLCDEAKARGAVSMSLEVRESNSAAIALYTSNGFSEIGVRQNYYTNPREAAIIMEKRL